MMHRWHSVSEVPGANGSNGEGIYYESPVQVRSLVAELKEKGDGNLVIHYCNTCTVHLLLVFAKANKCTIISPIITLLHVSTLL